MSERARHPAAATVIVVDVGNTSTAIGLYAGGRILRTGRLRTSLRSLRSCRAALRKVAGRAGVSGAVLSSVVPAANRLWLTALRGLKKGIRIVKVNHRLDLGVPVSYPRPEAIGADRLANACGASARYGLPVIVVDFGTAVTFDVVLPASGYVGGIIAPGLPLMFTYLHEKTALLPAIRPGPVKHAVGRSTQEAMRLGAVWGYRGLVREILAELRKGIGIPRAKVCATGGYASWVVKGSGLGIPVDPDLTLFGLGRIFEMNP
jgi:type III pantothenate kinase